MLFEQMCASSHCKLISSILLFCYAKVRKLEEADALLEEQKHRSAEFCEGNPNLLASPRTFLYLKRNYLFLNELKDSPALCFEKLCLGASWMMDRIKELLFSGGIAGSFCSWWLVFLQSHLKEFFFHQRLMHISKNYQQRTYSLKHNLRSQIYKHFRTGAPFPSF